MGTDICQIRHERSDPDSETSRWILSVAYEMCIRDRYYSSDPINEELLFLPLNGDEAEVVQKQIQTVIENRTYEKSPNGLA